MVRGRRVLRPDLPPRGRRDGGRSDAFRLYGSSSSSAGGGAYLGPVTSAVEFSPEALEQLAELYRYIAHARSVDVATGYADSIVEFCDELGSNPSWGVGATTYAQGYGRSASDAACLSPSQWLTVPSRCSPSTTVVAITKPCSAAVQRPDDPRSRSAHRQPERLVLDTLVGAGVPRSRSEALAWAVRLVGEHAEAWRNRSVRHDAGVNRLRTTGPGLVTSAVDETRGPAVENASAGSAGLDVPAGEPVDAGPGQREGDEDHHHQRCPRHRLEWLVRSCGQR